MQRALSYTSRAPALRRVWVNSIDGSGVGSGLDSTYLQGFMGDLPPTPHPWPGPTHSLRFQIAL